MFSFLSLKVKRKKLFDFFGVTAKLLRSWRKSNQKVEVWWRWRGSVRVFQSLSAYKGPWRLQTAAALSFVQPRPSCAEAWSAAFFDCETLTFDLELFFLKNAAKLINFLYINNWSHFTEEQFSVKRVLTTEICTIQWFGDQVASSFHLAAFLETSALTEQVCLYESVVCGHLMNASLVFHLF